MSTTMKEINRHFEFQGTYYDFLKEKMGDMFKGEAGKANGMIKDGSYHTGWDYLSSIERRCKFRSIAIKCMRGEEVFLKIRSGESYMEAVTGPGIFPRMKITKYLNDKQYGRKSINSYRYLWKCNEVCEILTPQEDR